MARAAKTETQKAWDALYKPLTKFLEAYQAEHGHPPFAFQGVLNVGNEVLNNAAAPAAPAAPPAPPQAAAPPMPPQPPPAPANVVPMPPQPPPAPPQAAAPPAPPAPPPPPPPAVGASGISDQMLTDAFQGYAQRYGMEYGQALLAHFQVDVISNLPDNLRQMALDAASK